jgi:hypothetical protein
MARAVPRSSGSVRSARAGATRSESAGVRLRTRRTCSSRPSPRMAAVAPRHPRRRGPPRRRRPPPATTLVGAEPPGTAERSRRTCSAPAHVQPGDARRTSPLRPLPYMFVRLDRRHRRPSTSDRLEAVGRCPGRRPSARLLSASCPGADAAAAVGLDAPFYSRRTNDLRAASRSALPPWPAGAAVFSAAADMFVTLTNTRLLLSPPALRSPRCRRVGG